MENKIQIKKGINSQSTSQPKQPQPLQLKLMAKTPHKKDMTTGEIPQQQKKIISKMKLESIQNAL